MFQPVLVFDSLHSSPFVGQVERLGFRTTDIRDPAAKLRKKSFPGVIIWDHPVTYRVLDEVPDGHQRFSRLPFIGELRLRKDRKGTLRFFHDPVGFLAYCFSVELTQVRYHWTSGGFTIRQTKGSQHE